MSAFFEAFNPAARHWREQQDLEKVLVIDTEKGSDGPRPLDLDSGVVRLVMPRRPAASPRQNNQTQQSNQTQADPPKAHRPVKRKDAD